MKTHEFVLRLVGETKISSEIESNIYKSKCDDCLISSSGNSVYLDFDREAPSRTEAILSAITDVQKAGYKAVLDDKK
jgi:hypothetical protein